MRHLPLSVLRPAARTAGTALATGLAIAFAPALAAQARTSVTADSAMAVVVHVDNNAPQFAQLPAASRATVADPLSVVSEFVEQGTAIAQARTKTSYRLLDNLPAVRVHEAGFVTSVAKARQRSVGTAQPSSPAGTSHSFRLSYVGVPGERLRVHVRLRSTRIGRDTSGSTPTDITGTARVDVGADGSVEFAKSLDGGRYLANHARALDATGKLDVKIDTSALLTSKANKSASYSMTLDVSIEPVQGMVSSIRTYGPFCGADVYGVSWITGKDRHLRTILEGSIPDTPAMLVVGVGRINIPLPGFACNLLTFPAIFLGSRTDATGRLISDFPSFRSDLSIDVNFQYGVLGKTTVSLSKGLDLRIYRASNRAYDHYDINHVLTAGQSLAMGGLGSPILSKTQSFKNMMFRGGVRAQSNSVEPLVETTWETMSSGLSSIASQLYGKPYYDRGSGTPSNTHDLLVSVHAEPGLPYALIKKGTQAFRNGINHVKTAEFLASAQNKSHIVRCVACVHGETDHQLFNTDYAKNITQWQADYEAEIQALGQTEPVPMLHTQLSSFTGYQSARSVIPGRQLAASVARPRKLVLLGPKYFLEYIDGIHLTSKGYRHMGEYYGKVYHRLFVEGGSFEPLRPLNVKRTGASILVRFHVPEPPLVLDTSLVSNPGNFGFEYWDSGPNSPTIQSVKLVDEDTVQITLTGTPTAAGNTIGYAHTGQIGAKGGPKTGARGNLRDSDATPSLHGEPLFNWAVHFTAPVN